jgi:N-acetylglucosamine malate deacetylase 1
MKRSRGRGIDVVALAPHPDDAELFCGGALLVAREEGRSTAIVDLTDGELSTNGDAGRRAAERDAATELLGLRERISLGLPDGALGTDGTHRLAVVEVLRELSPRVVLAPDTHDRHPDHAAAGRLAEDAAFLAGVTRYGGGRAHRPERIYRYLLHRPVVPTLLLDVSGVWDRRERLFEVYGSQVSRDGGAAATPINDGGFVTMLRARAAYFGAMAGVAYAEGFLVEGPLLVRSLVGLATPADAPASRYRAYL